MVMARRLRLSLALVALSVFVLVARVHSGEPASAQDPERPPNVLIVVTDDQRVSTLDVMDKTERAFSHEGVNFTNAYVTTPLCCPSRASILSGLYAHNHGVVRNSANDPLDYANTIPAKLEAAGYRTAMIGKLSNAWQGDEVPPVFDEIQMRWQHGATAEDDLAAESVDFIGERESEDERPWMLWLGTRAPHTPLLPDPEYKNASVPTPITEGQIERNIADKPGFVQKVVRKPGRTSAGGFDFRRYHDQIAFERQSRREMLSVDDMVGDIFEALERTGEDRDTLAFFISDNGYMAGEHGGLARKHMPYREATQVPMLMRWPGHVPAGLDEDQFVTNVDIAPTIYEAAGIDPGYAVDGRSLLDPTDRPYVYTERLSGHDWPRFEAVTTGRYHYIRSFRGESWRSLAEELYDLERDPYELQNLLDRPGAGPGALTALRGMAEAARHCVGAACP
jgi:arylsulfatase A-like enzyme